MSPDGGEQVDQGAPEFGEDNRIAIVLGAICRAEMIGRAPASEGKSIVGSALAVDDDVAMIGERLTFG